MGENRRFVKIARERSQLTNWSPEQQRKKEKEGMSDYDMGSHVLGLGNRGPPAVRDSRNRQIRREIALTRFE